MPAPAAGGAAGFWQPAAARPNMIDPTNPRFRLNALILTESFSFA
jgi:hypothetical protein